MAEQLQGKELSHAVAVALGWVPPRGDPNTVGGSLWHTLRQDQPDKAVSRRPGGGWWAFPPDYLDQRTDAEKLRWLYQRPHAEYLLSVWDKHDLTCRAELWAWLSHEECAPTHGEGRTLSEALCRLILAVGGANG